MFSIAMATYNGERHLAEQLRSLAEQTFLPDELVICDDGSIDSTADIVKRFATTAPFPVRFIRNEQRLRYDGNFMKAAGLCTAKYIAYCDQDDVWLRDKLAVARRYIAETQCALFQHGFQLIDGDGNLIAGDSVHWGLEGGPWWGTTRGMTQIFDRFLLSLAPLREISIDHTLGHGHLTHDQWIMFIGSLTGRVVTVKDVLVHYRQHDQNTLGFGTVVRGAERSYVGGTLQIVSSRWLGKAEAYRAKRTYLMTMIDRFRLGARSRAAIIEAIKRSPEKEKFGLLDESLAYYKQYERYSEKRMGIYTAASRLGRLHNLLSLYFTRSYQHLGGRGIWDSGLDVLYGVMD
jgi:glycosyltransferase involved in cell wall biosynthesis